jgi:hypothetical protein
MGPWGEQKAEILAEAVLGLESVENIAALF